MEVVWCLLLFCVLLCSLGFSTHQAGICEHFSARMLKGVASVLWVHEPSTWLVSMLVLSAQRQRNSGATTDIFLLALDDVTSGIKFGKNLLFAYSVKSLYICSFPTLKENKILWLLSRFPEKRKLMRKGRKRVLCWKKVRQSMEVSGNSFIYFVKGSKTISEQGISLAHAG